MIFFLFLFFSLFFCFKVCRGNKINSFKYYPYFKYVLNFYGEQQSVIHCVIYEVFIWYGFGHVLFVNSCMAILKYIFRAMEWENPSYSITFMQITHIPLHACRPLHNIMEVNLHKTYSEKSKNDVTKCRVTSYFLFSP